MEPTERIEVRRIYPKSAAKFGLLYGALTAVLVAIFVLIAGLFTPTGFRLFGLIYGATVVSLLMIILISILVTIASIFILFFVGALLYNLTARLGPKLHIGLAES